MSVRLLTDWIGMRGIRYSFVAGLRRAGVEHRVFNTPGFRAWLGFVPRDHRKLLVVDSARRHHRRRRHRRRVDGQDEAPPRSLARHRRAHRGARRARHAGGVRHDVGARAEEERRGSHRLTRRVARGAHLDPATAEPALVGIVEGEPLRLRIARALQIQAISAERSIWIANAYFVPSWSEVEALIGAARDGVDVRILVPQRNDHPWVTLLTRRYYRRLLTNGVRIWECKGAMMHAKTSVVDGRWVRVGSTDFNPLGVAINYELDAVIEDPELGAQAEAMFLGDLERSRGDHACGVASSAGRSTRPALRPAAPPCRTASGRRSARGRRRPCPARGRAAPRVPCSASPPGPRRRA